MSEIDIQNAKQIRDPMQVLITMSLAVDDINMTYSGYSSAKVADGVLNKRDWTMRRLADLQGEGFPLDGSHVLYDSSTPASQANGKLGVRSNVGQGVSVTVTGDKTIASLGINVTGAESVTYNGETITIAGNSVSIPVLNFSAELAFAPATETERIEIISAEPESDFKITNDNLIKATVSLRSDLSLVEPTLPESELNIEVYNNIDVSEAVAEIPEDTPIIYQAGYEGDMSPARKFYVAGQITWADNVISIHAVDAVHFLEKDVGFSMLISRTREVFRFMAWAMIDAGVTDLNASVMGGINAWPEDIVIDRMSIRDMVAAATWIVKRDRSTGQEFLPRYVDAGIPTLSGEPKSVEWSIQEEDCGDVTKNVEPAIGGVEAIFYDYDSGELHWNYRQTGTFSWYKGKCAFLSIDDYTQSALPALTNDDYAKSPYGGRYSPSGASSIIPNTTTGNEASTPRLRGFDGQLIGRPLIDGNVEQGRLVDDYGGTIYTQVIPWGCYYNPGVADWYGISSQAGMWNDLIRQTIFDSALEMHEGVMWGRKISKTPITYNFPISGAGKTVTIDFEKIWGGGGNKLPSELSLWISKQSNITGSFTWKGDPRMQPRDISSFKRLDGTVEEITLENITLTHEGGGTSAEITYRKGVV